MIKSDTMAIFLAPDVPLFHCISEPPSACQPSHDLDWPLGAVGESAVADNGVEIHSSCLGSVPIRVFFSAALLCLSFNALKVKNSDMNYAAPQHIPKPNSPTIGVWRMP